MSESEERSRVTHVLVKNLSESATEEDLKRIFGEFGSITSTVVKRHDDGTSKCFGLVDFENPEDADRAVESLNGKEFDDKKWVVEGAQERYEIEQESKIHFDELALKDDAGEGSRNSKLYVKNRDQRRGTGVFTPMDKSAQTRQMSVAGQGQRRGTGVFTPMARGVHQGPRHGAGAFRPVIHPLYPPHNLAWWAQSSPAAKNPPLGYYGFAQYAAEESSSSAIENLNVGRFVPKEERTMRAERPRPRNVYVGNLSESVTEEDLKNTFGEFGSIARTVVKRNEDGTSRCYGIVTFRSDEDAAKAIESLNGREFSGKKWLVERTQTTHERVTEITSKKLNLYVSGLDDSCDDDQKLKELFSPYGSITTSVLLRSEGKSKGAGFVAFSSPEEASTAISQMNGKEIGRSRYLHVEHARTNKGLQIETVPPAAPATTSPAAVSPVAIAPVPAMEVYNIHAQPSVAPATMSPQIQFGRMAPVQIHGQPSFARAPPAITMPPQLQFGRVSPQMLHDIRQQISYEQQPPPATTSPPQTMVRRPKAQQQQVWRPKAQQQQQQGPPRPQGN